jgi:LacI family transcriptional regulator
VAVTIKHIAAHAGVSASTVSRVLNRNSYVSEAVRVRIEKAIEELQYQPSWAARSLRGKSSFLVGLIIPDILNTYYTAIAKSILENLNRQGYNLIIQISNEDPDLDLAYLRLLYDRRVDGIIHVPVVSGRNSVYVREIAAKGMPMIELNRQTEPELLDAVLADNYEGAYIATQYLLGLGHRRIGMICGATTVNTGRDRMNGYRKALDEADVPFDPALARTGLFSKQWGTAATHELLNLDPPPTAIFSSSNRLLVGTMGVLAERKVRVPDDLSIISFDDSEWLSLWQPPVTTVDIAVEEMAMLAVQLLLRRIQAGKPAEKPVTYRLSVKLLERQSCRRISLRTRSVPSPALADAPERRLYAGGRSDV